MTDSLQKSHIASLVDLLGRPESWAHRPPAVEHLQTHSAHLFMAPPWVFKLKKPLNLGFLDFRTPDLRREACMQEVELNRRLCSDIYLGVLPVYLRDGMWQLGTPLLTPEGGTSCKGRESARPPQLNTDRFLPEEIEEPADYLVWMKLLPEEGFLLRKVKNGETIEEILENTARKLIGFYRKSRPAPEILEMGKPDKVARNIRENFDQTKRFIGKTIDRLTWNTVSRYSYAFLEKHENLFLRRMEEERIVDGHGDLHLEHIHTDGNRICIYDCIEFNTRFRYLDVASDLAFLAMDLDFHRRERESMEFLNTMADGLQDPDLLQLSDFYKCYRAYVRGKVRSIQSADPSVPPDEAVSSAQIAARYFRLSLRYALFGSGPFALLFMGPVGGGKSTLSRNVSEATGVALHSSDITRKDLAGIPHDQRLPDSQRAELYTAEMNRRTYGTLQVKVWNSAERGEPLLIDATFSRREMREEWIRMLDDRQIPWLLVEVSAPKDLRRKRLEERDRMEAVVSDARVSEMAYLDRRYEPPEEVAPDRLIRIDTTPAPQETLGALLEQVAGIHLQRDS